VTALNGRLFQVAGQALVPVSLPASLRALPIRNVFRDSSGTLWMGTDGQGVVRFSETSTERYTMRQGLVNDFVRAFCEDREGGLWIGTDGGLSRFSAGRFQNFNIESGLVYGSIRLLLADRSGNLWIGTDGGLSRFARAASSPTRCLNDCAVRRFGRCTKTARAVSGSARTEPDLFLLKAWKPGAVHD
jgi:ligand-binding sensor domain-containing protein